MRRIQAGVVKGEKLSRSLQPSDVFLIPRLPPHWCWKTARIQSGRLFSRDAPARCAGGFLLRRRFCESQCFEPVIKVINPMIAGRTLDCHSKTVAAGLVDVDLGIRASCL